MTVHGIMKVWFDPHGDFDSKVLDPLYLKKEDAIKAKNEEYVWPGTRLELVHFHVV